jgi:ABC-type polar amino acid transport system ATPase subunit
MSLEPAPLQPLVRVTGLDKWHGDVKVLNGVSLELHWHERVVVCGPSGSGKSTLLRCLNGLDLPQAGTVVVDGIELTRASVERVRRQVGMVFQSFNLFPHMTVLDNCTVAPIAVRGLRAAEAREIAHDYLDRVRMARHAHKYPGQLSGGEQQRVAIARALCMNPTLMLLDEPTSALDPEMIQDVLDIVLALAEDGMTMLCVTHEMGFARRVADRVLFMDHGEIVEQGPPGRLFDAPGTDRLRMFLSRRLPGGPIAR